MPSWAFGNSGTRFKVFPQPGVPRDPYEKIADAAQVNAFTGSAPSVALHIPWDRVDDYTDLAKHATDLGVRLGTINSNVFQDNDYMLGSVANPDAGIRRKATDHLLECVDIMDATGSRDLKLWFADGTNYPGQDDIVARQDRLAAALSEVYDRLGEGQRMLLEYKLFEPAFYSTDVPDWGTAYTHCIALGPKAAVVLDTGHHAPGTNIEFIVAVLLRAGRLGGFDFNSRFYADDDLMVGAADPFQLFRIMWEVRRGGGLDPATGVAFMLDQCHNIEPKIAAQIRSVMNAQEATAKALSSMPTPSPRRSSTATCSEPTPCSWTPTTPMCGRCSPTCVQVAGSIPTLSRRTTGRATTSRCAPSARVAPPPAGERDDGQPDKASTVVAELVERSNRLGADPRNTNYAGGNTSAKGEDVDPVTDAAGRAAVGQGERRRPRDAHRRGLGGAPPRPGARPGRRLPRRRPRGRDGRRLRLLPPRRRGSVTVDRHGDARPRRGTARRPPPSRTPASPWPPPPTARR